ncbi:low temperature requirement protein LtrA [Litoreibacter meonggei]|uniref:Low temperature requirement protein LtrA n=1 Tax=Litoreibacter meonggei TaxID=1049199 RepID=A0A497VCY3_9RHOB|nr:low temperature requirement protein A [Litoreibacter meonggei]RLJ41340.1 low temperature requirement protein LtrA [Litoreibacter meonggei]
MILHDFIHFPARDPKEGHRSATPLELMFDLASVIAIAAAAHGLAHAVEGAHSLQGIIGFLCSFFMIWLAWMNYTWFASAYDDDSTAFRILTMVIMFGALMLAAGINAVFANERIWLALLGFVVMRLGMAVFWLGAARAHLERRKTALRYAAGIVAMQVYWVALVVFVPPTAAMYLPLFIVGAAGELFVPVFAERHGTTGWHRHHMIERYGLLNIIVLGETFIAITAMIQINDGSAFPDPALLWLAVLSAVISFSLWGLYFTDEDHLSGDEMGHALLWGYGHFVLFAAGAATGAGMLVMLQVVDHSAHVELRVAVLATAIPIAVYVGTLWLIRDRLHLDGAWQWTLPVIAGTILLIGFAAPQMALELIAVLLVLTALVRRRLTLQQKEMSHD